MIDPTEHERFDILAALLEADGSAADASVIDSATPQEMEPGRRGAR